MLTTNRGKQPLPPALSPRQRLAILNTRSRQVQAIILENRRLREGDWANPRGSKKPLWTVLPDGAWAGRRCFLIGGGPSLQDFDFNRLRGELTIAVNRAFEHMPWATMMFSMDNRYYRWLIKGAFGPEVTRKFNAFRGLRVWLDLMNGPYQDVHYVRGLANSSLAQSVKLGIFHGNNSGFCALMLARCLGASPIYLLGYDMKATGRKTHYHSGYPMRQSAGVTARFIPHFVRAAPGLRSAGVQVINLNPESALTCFPFGNVDRILPRRSTDGEVIKPGDTAQESADAWVLYNGAADNRGPDVPSMLSPDVPEVGPLLASESGLQDSGEMYSLRDAGWTGEEE